MRGGATPDPTLDYLGVQSRTRLDAQTVDYWTPNQPIPFSLLADLLLNLRKLERRIEQN